MLKWLALLLLLPLSASAQTTMPAWKCGWFSMCLPAYSPPVDALRVYVGGKIDHERRPYWFAAGGGITSEFVCGPTASSLSFTVVRGTSETAPASPMTLSSSSVVQACSGTPDGTPFTVANVQSAADVMANLGTSCLSNSACSQLVLSTCMANPTCKGSISSVLKVDVDMDGRITTNDARLVDLIVNGSLK